MPGPISTIDRAVASGGTKCGTWTITYAQFPIGRPELGFGFATHGMLVVRDGHGGIAAIYEGLAHGLRRDGSLGTKAIGTVPGDTIRFCRDDPSIAYRYHHRYPADDRLLLSGPESQIVPRMRIAEEIGARINALSIGYPPFGVFGIVSRNRGFANANSNAVIATLVTAMGLEQPLTARFCPGRRVILLEAAEIEAIRTRHGIAPACSARHEHLARRDRARNAPAVILAMIPTVRDRRLRRMREPTPP